jgi:hypothetical protein
VTFYDRKGRCLVVPVGGQKGLEIRLGNPNQSIDPMRYEKAIVDPSANRAFAALNGLGDLFLRVEFRRCFWFVGFHLGPH